MSMPSPAQPTAVPALLAVAAGFTDAVGFVGLAGLFTAHVTGNLVLLGVELAGFGHGAIGGKLLAVPVFVLSVLATRCGHAALVRRGVAPLVPLLLAEAVLLLAFLAAGVGASPVRDADAPLAMLAGMAGVAAMGMQNAAVRLVLPDLPPTTVMTSNTVQAVLEVADLAGLGDAPPRGEAGHLRRLALVVIAFAGGAALGALGFGRFGFWCLAVPVCALLLAALAAAACPRRAGRG